MLAILVPRRHLDPLLDHLVGGSQQCFRDGEAEPTYKLDRPVGCGASRAAEDPEGQARITALQQALPVFNWIAGRNVQIDYRWAADDADGYAMKLIEQAPAIVVASSNPDHDFYSEKHGSLVNFKAARCHLSGTHIIPVREPE
jgi:hypothetical protein